ncbi:conserved hypothetical protein [Arcobacter nitrofigilis DSM 7299]|uniref:Lipoprotein n=1 Tax=Arcobacter nitrofigilis (strain ATCC 33309 / DSM 7299 / CCUG 15893 / LMG 7604 / NCTC 12251 / CI) TaxID=572480 RepID=D5V766_ARCNC|nr:hypothetical protein [Arcobacter nitrofigilis]ADG94486.1 conserved hypothetical protein [Arcobacter nitrofigilis DSM 7299]
MKNVIFNMGLLCMITFFTGCSNSLQNTAISSMNKKIENTNQPYEFVKYKDTNRASYYSNTKIRGEKGKSIVSSEVLFNDIMRNIYLKCDYTEFDLVEKRVVLHDNPYFYEVWVFRDEKSKTKDKTTALGINMKQLQNGRGTDFSIIGNCPAIPKSFVFTK